MWGLKKKMAASLILSLGLSSAAFADFIYSQDSQPYFTQPNFGPPTFVNNCDPCGSWCDKISVYGSWLYWKVNGDELDYAVVKKRTIPTGEVINGFIKDRECIHDVKGGWDSGFRLGIGAEFPCLCWRGDVVWTHF